MDDIKANIPSEPLLVVARTANKGAARRFDSPNYSYVSYFENQDGEQLILTWKAGEERATLWHSDMDWRPAAVGATFTDEARALKRLLGCDPDEAEPAAAAHGDPVTSTMSVVGEEVLWLRACWFVVSQRIDREARR